MSGRCGEEINTKEKEVESSCLLGNLTPSCLTRTQKFKGQTSTAGMQPRHTIEIVPQENISIEAKATSELSTSDFSNSSSDLVPYEDEPSSSSCNKVKKPNNASGGGGNASDGTVLSNDEGISDGPNNDLSSDESTTYENEGSFTEDSAKAAKCFTFSSITPPNVEDISANCCNLDWDKWASEHQMEDDTLVKNDSRNLITNQDYAQCSPITNVSVSHKEGSYTGKGNTSKIILKSIRNPSLPAVVIHSSDCDSSPTLIRDTKPTSKKKKQDYKKCKKKEVLNPATRSNSLHSAQSSNVNNNLCINLESSCNTSKNSSKEKVIPLLNLPSDDESEDSKSKKKHKTKGPQAKVPKPIQIPHIKETPGDSLDSPKVKKRRKSIVDILFPKQQSSLSSTPPETPPVNACKNNASSEIFDSCSESILKTSGENRLAPSPAPNRLTLRRLSDICIGKKKDKEITSEKCLTKDDIGIYQNECGHFLCAKDTESRRSSVTFLDNTDQFKITKELFLQEERRRMSSFPPSDGDETSIMLQKIHAISKLNMEQDSLKDGIDCTNNILKPVEPSKPSPFKFLGLLSVGKKSSKLSKSSADIPAQIHAASSQSHVDNQRKASDEPSGSRTNRLKLMHLPISTPQNNTYLKPNTPLPQRRCSSPLIAELEAMRKDEAFYAQQATQMNKPLSSNLDKTGSITSLPQFGLSFEGKKSGIDRSGVVVFPKRKVEDVPGIFIPGQKSKPTAAPPRRIFHPPSQHSVTGADDNIVNKNLLGITREGSDRRRHSISMSDPALVEKQFSAVKSSFPPLLPRSPYVDTTNITIPFLDGRYERNNLIKTFLKQK
jgi:hypothetical protein